jgi:hypothetical protein
MDDTGPSTCTTPDGGEAVPRLASTLSRPAWPNRTDQARNSESEVLELRDGLSDTMP